MNISLAYFVYRETAAGSVPYLQGLTRDEAVEFAAGLNANPATPAGTVFHAVEVTTVSQSSSKVLPLQ